MMRMQRRGFALAVVLWFVVAMGVMASVASMTARESIAAASNRVGIIRASWLAEGCVSVALADLEAFLAGGDPNERWAVLDSALLSTDANCALDVRPAGLSLNINTVTDTGLVRALTSAGVGVEAIALTDAILDWRDADDDPRPAGVERDWYMSAGRVTPRNASFEDPRELHYVRDFDARLLSLFDTDGDPVLLTRAQAAVLAGLPGMTDESVEAIIDARDEQPYPDLALVADRLTEGARQAMLAALPALRQLTTATPVAWILRVTGRAPIEDMEATVELRVARDNRRLAVVRRRSWP